MSEQAVSTTRFQPFQIAFACLAGALFTFTMWGVWYREFDAFGINVTLFLISSLLVLHTDSSHEGNIRFAAFAAPFVMIAANFALWESPYLRVITILLFFPMVFVALRMEQRGSEWRWKMLAFLESLFEYIRACSVIPEVVRELPRYLPARRGGCFRASGVEGRIIRGLLALGAIACFVVIPLLASADADFARLLEDVIQFADAVLAWVFDSSPIMRVIWFAIIALGLLALAGALTRSPSTYPDAVEEHDAIIAGIVLGGIIMIYATFLYLQATKLFVSVLPEDFATTELIVKSGFWQLFVLTALNIVLVNRWIRDPARVIARLLTTFLVASVLLLFSAGYRMTLYVVFYGLSVEKFFAMYTVLYCFIAFGFLFVQLIARDDRDTIRFFAKAALWMYAVACVLPVENIIVFSNLALRHVPGSRQEFTDMRMLSSDVLLAVQANRDTLVVPSTQEKEGTMPVWSRWEARQLEILKEKRWYELSISALINRLAAQDVEAHAMDDGNSQCFVATLGSRGGRGAQDLGSTESLSSESCNGAPKNAEIW